MDKPRSVPIIGWTFIIVGGVTVLTSLWGLKLVLSKDIYTNPSWIVMVLTQLFIAVVAIIAGVRFMKGSRMMRTILEAISWLILGAMFWFSWGAFITLSHDVLGKGITIFNFLLFVVPITIIIYKLRGSKIRSYLDNCNVS